jgi:NAD(P)-dependent dehydrogenase (short-subunit alcohol dehydrogenase family)
MEQLDDVAALFAVAQERFGTIDVMLNNAAWTTPLVHFLDISEDFLDAVLQNNLKSMFLCAQAAARWMVAQEKPGAIVNMSSVGAVRAHHSMVAYDASKGAVEAATRAMAIDLAPKQIRVNVVGPSSIVIPAWRATLTSEANMEMARRMVPLTRLGAPADIASAVLFLASDDAAFITGQVLYVDGGMTAQLRSGAFE